MQTYELLVRNRSIAPNSQDMTLVRTSIGIDQVHILFSDDEWTEFPVSITFAQNDTLVTETLVVTELPDTSEFSAEATVTVPHEVIDMVGPIRVTLQGTDANGRHIITAAGAPLSVEEAGDVIAGTEPSDSPAISQWEQAYADAMMAVNQASSAVANLQARIDEIVSEARTSIESIVESAFVPATRESLGSVMVGYGLDVTEQGEIYVSVTTGISEAQASQLENLAALAYYCFDTEFDDDGTLLPTAKIKAEAMPKATPLLPGAVIPDGTSIGVTSGGVISTLQ